MQNELEDLRRDVRAQFAAMQQLMTERTGQILAAIAHQDEADARVRQRLRLPERPTERPTDCPEARTGLPPAA